MQQHGQHLTMPQHHKNGTRTQPSRPAHPETHQNLIHNPKQQNHVQWQKPPHAVPETPTKTPHPASVSVRASNSTHQQPPTPWRRTESNRRPPACKAGALPIELRPRSTKPVSCRAKVSKARGAAPRPRWGPRPQAPSLKVTGDRKTN